MRALKFVSTSVFRASCITYDKWKSVLADTTSPMANIRGEDTYFLHNDPSEAMTDENNRSLFLFGVSADALDLNEQLFRKGTDASGGLAEFDPRVIAVGHDSGIRDVFGKEFGIFQPVFPNRRHPGVSVVSIESMKSDDVNLSFAGRRLGL
jgi:hypothetical protein